jgi:amidohydrolase
LSFSEFLTRERIINQLLNIGLKVEKISKTGVIGLINSEKRGDVIALRSDMDALPISEKNNFSFKSKNNGVMHACGHDMHMSCLLGAARILYKIKEKIPGVVKFIFQPAEETLEGANFLIQRGVLKNPKVKAIIGFHNSPDILTGNVGLKEGHLFAAVDNFKVHFYGKSSHAALPERGKDAIISASTAILALQTIISKGISPLDRAILNIGKIKGGLGENIICDHVDIAGTIRTFSSFNRKCILEKISKILDGISRSFDTKYKIEINHKVPTLKNDEKITSLCRKAVKKIIGGEKIIKPHITFGGEDFAIYQSYIPGCYFLLGIKKENNEKSFPWHSSYFDIDEQAIPIGAAILSQIVYDFFKR